MNMDYMKFLTTENTELTEKEESSSLTGKIIGAAIEVHRALGPGLLESVYETCLIYELKLRGLKVKSQKPMPVFYKDVMLDCGYRADLVVEEQVIVEIKSVTSLAPIHEAQLLSYLKLSDCKIGILTWVQTQLEQVPLDPTSKKHVELALEEAVVNIIEHGAKNSLFDMTLICRIEPNRQIEFEITDTGPPFNPLSSR